jgi:hypothetical protein
MAATDVSVGNIKVMVRVSLRELWLNPPSCGVQVQLHLILDSAPYNPTLHKSMDLR